MIKLFLSIAFPFFCIVNSNAQRLSVDRFEEKPNDITARTNPRQDINGNDCALVKVQLAAANAVFDGNVIGDVAYETSLYMVYMSQGSKRVTIRLEGYLPLEVNFEDYGIKSLEGKMVYVMTVSGVSATKSIEPVRTKTGWIVISSKPSGATVYINDEFVGNTPLTNYKQAYGTYTYRLEHPNYHSSTGTIELNSGKTERTVELKPAFGAIAITSNVSGAKVLLDGKATNKVTPCTLEEVPSGQHNVQVQKDKYSPRQQNVVVEDGQTAQLSVSLDARFAQVSITSLDGAQIYCNGESKGTTRYTEDMMEGYYDIEARLAHHKPASKQIQVVAGQSQVITLNPTPIYGSLDVTSTPHGADVTIDGKYYGETPYTIEALLEGEHTVALSKEGYSIYKKVVTISDGKNETLSATMQKGIQINEEELSIKITGFLTKEDWEKLKTTCKTHNIRIVDLGNADFIVIPNHAFSSCSSLTSITIPNSVTEIGSRAFEGCTGLTSITIPNSVTKIGSSAFEGCTGLTSITIPNSVTEIGYDAFDDTEWYRKQPFGLIYAGRVAYKYKGKMPYGTEIILREGTIGIAECAFGAIPGLWSSCTGLTSIIIPNTVTNIGKYAFLGVEALTSIVIPNSVTKIGDGAFRGCKGLTSVIIPNSVTMMGKEVFQYCESLTSINIPNSVTYISEGTFEGCKRLYSFSIPNSITKIEKNAFKDCTGLTSITIPNSVTEIGGFPGCTSLKSISIPSSVTMIGEGAFSGCTGLTSITIPNSVTKIGGGAFRECEGLTSIILPNSVTMIGEGAFFGCTGLTSFTIPNSVTEIADYTFCGCCSLSSVTIPNNISQIGMDAFEDCTGLTSITIPNSVKDIRQYAFSGCTSLRSITIPNSVREIWAYAFDDCTGLTSIIIPIKTKVGTGAFRNCPRLKIRKI